MTLSNTASSISSNTATTVTRLTSLSPSAIAVLQVEGPVALEYLKRIWRPNQGESSLAIDAIRYGFTIQPGQANGESIVVCRTGKHRVEIHCHGGRFASESILRTLVSFGAIEQSTHSLIHAPDVEKTIAEAREDLVRAATLRTTTILLDQMRGALYREFNAIQVAINHGNAADALRRLKKLEDRSPMGCHLIEPWRVVLAGPPNTGKSSLLNLLLGYSRAIVHEQAGTTRDLLSERSSFDGWPIELIDGAGIRAATDEVEATGVQNTLLQIASADCTLLLVDRTTGWTETHSDIVRHCKGKVVLVSTKSDLVVSDTRRDRFQEFPSQFSQFIVARVETSSLTGAGLSQLMDAVVSALVPQAIDAAEPVPFRHRHREMMAALNADAIAKQT